MSLENSGNFWQEKGIALLIAVIALSVFSLLGLYVSVNSTTEVRISENYESHLQADLAARAGLNHARDLIRGLRFNDLLRGPDGVGTSTYPSTVSGKYAFRNWIDWPTARALNILDPSSSVGSLLDDGLFNTGKVGGTPGTPLIPKTGVAMTAPNPYGPGTVITARYFVKVTDNNDGDGDPFSDVDRIIFVRSTGVAQTIRETGVGPAHANSVALYEAMYKEYRLFDLDVPFAIQGDLVLPASSNMFNGNAFKIDGNPNLYGIGTIDTNPSNLIHPADLIKLGLSPTQYDQIKGACCPLTPAVGDITASLTGDQRLLLDPNFLWNVSYNLMPQFADNLYKGNQNWTGGFTDDLGYYNPSKPIDDPSQRFKITYVNGDLDIAGDVSGAGILFVTGKLSIRGSLKWAGMALVVGGSADLSGHGAAMEGNLYLANLQPGNPPTFGTPAVTVGGSSSFETNSSLLRMVLRQLPPMEVSRREITSSMDP